MDFQSLSRKELQVLCKKNKIPANMTNVAMADALAALPNVEGIDEVGNGQSALLSPQTCKGSSRRPIKQVETATENEPKSSVTTTRTRRAPLKTANQEVAKENNDNPPRLILKTPATRTTRRRAAAATSVCKTIEDDKAEEKDGKDEEKSVRGTRGYTTRRSTRVVTEKKGKSITADFESSALSEAENGNHLKNSSTVETDKGTSENDESNTEETLNAQAEKSDVGSQVSNSVVSVDDVLVTDNARNAEGEKSVTNVGLDDFSVDGDQAIPQADVNQVSDTFGTDANQVQSAVDDPPKLDELDISESDVAEVVIPVASDISKMDVAEVQNFVVDLSTLDEAKPDVEVVVPVAEDISEKDGDEVLVAAVDDDSNVNTSEVLISSADDFKPVVDQCLTPTENQVSVEDGLNAPEVCNNENQSELENSGEKLAEQLTSLEKTEEPSSTIEIQMVNVQVDEPDLSLQVQAETEIDSNQKHSETEGVETINEPEEPSSTIEIQMDNVQVDKPDLSFQVQAETEIDSSQKHSETEGLETMNEPSEITAQMDKPDSSLQVRAETENDSNPETERVETMNEPSEITTQVLPFSSSTTSTPSQVPTTPKLAASDSKQRLTSQMKLSNKKAATPIPKMTLEVFKEDNDIMVVAEEKEKTSQVPTTPRLAASDSKQRLTSQMKLSNKKAATPIPKMALEVFKEDNDIMAVAEEKEKPSSDGTMNVAGDKENNINTIGENTAQKSLKKKSVRQLKKLLKQKLETGGDNGKENMPMEKVRPALQTLTDNCMVGNEEN